MAEMNENQRMDNGLEIGNASESLIRAAEAASSAATESTGTTVEDTTQQTGTATAGATPDATAQAAAVESTGQAPRTGEAPQSRIEAAVKNAREQAARETEARIRQEMDAQFGAFKGMNPEEVQLALQVLTELRTDPSKFYQELSQRLNGGKQEQDEPFPEPDLVSKDGQLKSYRAETVQKLLEMHGTKVQRQLMKELKPFLDFAKGEQDRRASEAQIESRMVQLEGALKEMRTYKHFTKENESKILAVIQTLPQELRRNDPVRALHIAYNKFLETEIFPNINRTAENRVVENFNKKAAASDGTVSPNQPSGDPKKRELRGVSDLARRMQEMAESAG